MKVDQEEWRVIPHFPDYEVSSHGRIRKKIPGVVGGKIMKPGKDRNGYLRIEFSSNRKQRIFYSVHHLVAETFIGPQKMGEDCHHIDSNKLNNHKDNLAYICHNTHSAMKKGKPGRPIKLTVNDIHLIRQHKADGLSAREIAGRFNVSTEHVHRILSGKKWAWVGEAQHEQRV